LHNILPPHFLKSPTIFGYLIHPLHMFPSPPTPLL